ncbi:leucine--tRNA ligase [Aureliella helgolandensis]|uniref:Leucine--tRNA ligase n=1 Tax=Aureliella helgolandensis TaxID=2527968 RepID=A0A518G6Z4_9BACT|nr:leucine--tRNA ligase [Aureliella helgolandensis]QDV24358.1 Leucine--tRNA ligase [Aureliella helgolandensis]
MPRYNPAEIEPKWQKYWDSHHTFRTPDLPQGEKLYVLDMFPYPSGSGLHVGHPEGYTATDIVCRYARMQGKTVLHPMGFDAFGLPAEEHAIKTNTPPRVSTEKNIAEFTRQLRMLGFSYDWERTVSTTDVDYFRWTQWIFLVLFDTWYDAEQQRGRPIAELPIPQSVLDEGEASVAAYRDSHRLAYQGDALVNWCPALGTVLANEEVIDGKSERGDHPVQRIPLRQWMLRITSYAERLISDLEGLDWSPGIKKLQSEWIGRSTGAEVDFFLGEDGEFAAWQAGRKLSGFPRDAGSDCLRVYTTRPDTLFGATYMVVAPEHPLVQSITSDAQREEVEAYCKSASFKSDRERTESESRKKTGVFTGAHAINPVNGRPVPIWIADYVLASYGTGAIMAVPAHDQRDFEFAQQFALPIIPVVDPGDAKDVVREQVLAGKSCFGGMGHAVNSGSHDGLSTAELKSQLTEELQAAGAGQEAVNYKLRDWLFSRQRFWGEPFPILHELDAEGQPTGAIRALEPEELPLNLPHLEDYKPHGRPEPPLGKSPDEWLYVERDGKRYRRETNTMPQWAGSCWYYLRFIDPKNQAAFCDPVKEKAWMPVDLYVGGAEHAVLHLLYARFWHKVLFDRGYVSTVEPFQKLVNQGMILGEVEYTGYQLNEQWMGANEVGKNDAGELACLKTKAVVVSVKLEEASVKKKGDAFVLAADESIRVDSRAHKMSKSRGNVVNPDEIVQEYGADSLRLYEMFMGPLEATKPWSMSGVSGVRNFLDRVWRMFVDYRTEEVALIDAIQSVEPTLEQNQMLHRTIASVTQALDSMSYNTAIARLMEFVNFFTKEEVRPRQLMADFVLLLSPLAPHLAEELWELLGHTASLAYEDWPTYDEAMTKSSEIEIPLQVNGKLRSRITVSAECTKAELETLALADARIQELIAGKQIVKTIAVPGRLFNVVVK